MTRHFLQPTTSCLPPRSALAMISSASKTSLPTLAGGFNPQTIPSHSNPLPEDVFTATTTSSTDLDAGMQIALNGAATINSPDGGAKHQREALEEHERRVAEGRRR